MAEKKTCTWRGVTCCSSFTSDFYPYAFYMSNPRVLLVTESKENIYGEYVDFRVEIIVENYVVPLYIFLNYLIIGYNAWKMFQVISKDVRVMLGKSVFWNSF